MARTLPRCQDCNQCMSGPEHTRCRPCSYAAQHKAAQQPVAFDLPDWPPLRDYPGQPALVGGYTLSELAHLSTLINSRGPWRPARWHKPLAAWMEEIPA